MKEKFGFDSIGNKIGRALIKVAGLNIDLDNPRSTAGTHDDLGPIKDLPDLEKVLSKVLGGGASGLMSAYSNFLRMETERRRLYAEYDKMDLESDVIATALDIYTEDACDFDRFVGARVWVTAADEKVAEEANAALAQMKLNAILPRVTRNLAKYGDIFVRAIGRPSKNDAESLSNSNDKKNQDADSKAAGILKLDTSYHPSDVMPVVRDYRLLGYHIFEGTQTLGDGNIYAPWDFVHFAIPGDSNFVRASEDGFGVQTGDDSSSLRGNVAEYGQSPLRAAIRPYRRSKLMHDILAISRMSRSPLKRVFKFQTESDSPIMAAQQLVIFKKTMEKIGGVDKINDKLEYDDLMDILTRDIYIPVMRGGKGDYAFESVGGDVDVSNIVDIELFDNRLYMALRIPKEFLNFGEATGDRQTLLIKDIRYAKRISKIQGAVKVGVKELIFIHFAYLGKILGDTDFDVHMVSTSISEDLERIDFFGNAVNTTDSLVRMLESFTDDQDEEDTSIDKGYLLYYILENIVKLPDFKIDTFFPGAKKYKDEPKEQKAKDKRRRTVELVTSNKSKILEMTANKFGTSTALKEATNADIKRDYRTERIPLDMKYDQAGLKEALDIMIRRKIKRESYKV